jgi:hypothetical protein
MHIQGEDGGVAGGTAAYHQDLQPVNFPMDCFQGVSWGYCV